MAGEYLPRRCSAQVAGGLHRLPQAQAAHRFYLILAGLMLILLNCSSSVTNDIELSGNCVAPREANRDIPFVSFVTDEQTNIFEGAEISGGGRADGNPTSIHICLAPTPREFVILEYGVNSPAAGHSITTPADRGVGYTISSPEMIRETNYLLVEPGETRVELQAVAKGDNNANDMGSFEIKLLEDPGASYTLGNVSTHPVAVFDPPLVMFTKAASSLNESSSDPHTIMLESDTSLPIDITARFQVTGTANRSEYELSGVEGVPGRSDQYEVTIPANMTSAGFGITAAADSEADIDDVIFTIVDTDSSNAGAQARHTATIFSPAPPPTFTGAPYSFTANIETTANGMTLGTLSATAGATITYSFEGTSCTAALEIDASSGEVKVLDQHELLFNSGLDFPNDAPPGSNQVGTLTCSVMATAQGVSSTVPVEFTIRALVQRTFTWASLERRAGAPVAVDGDVTYSTSLRNGTTSFPRCTSFFAIEQSEGGVLYSQGQVYLKFDVPGTDPLPSVGSTQRCWVTLRSTTYSNSNFDNIVRVRINVAVQ